MSGIVVKLLLLLQILTIFSLWRVKSFTKLAKCNVNSGKKLGIVIPFCDKHISRVEAMLTKNWKRYPPRNNHFFPIYLYFYYSGDLEMKPLIRKKLETLVMSHWPCFTKVHYLSANLPAKHDVYPLGPSLMFFHLFNQPLIHEMQAIMWMEPDVYPCKPDWLMNLYVQAFTGSSFWIKGSIQRAAPENDGFLAQADHINGNAIYYRDSLAFYEFLSETADAFTQDPESYLQSFDIALWLIFRHGRSYMEYADLRCMYSYTDYIQNYYVRSVNATELCRKNQETYLVHGSNVFF